MNEKITDVIFETVLDGIVVVDAETKIIKLMNPSMLKMLDYNENEVDTLTVKDIHPKESLSFVIEQFEKQLKGEIKIAENIPIIKKNGDILYCDVNSKKTFIDNKPHLIGIFRDITEKRESERNLKERIKELHCMHEISKIVEEKTQLNEILSEIIKVIPDSWQFPEICCAKLYYNDELFKFCYSKNCCKEPVHFLTSDIFVKKKSRQFKNYLC